MPGAGAAGADPRNGFCAVDSCEGVLGVVRPADAAGAGGLVIGGVCVEVADGSNGGTLGCDAAELGGEVAVLFAATGVRGATMALGGPAVAAFAGESVCGGVEGAVAAPGSGGSSGRSGIGGTVGEVVFAPAEASAEVFEVDLFVVASALAMGFAVAGADAVGALVGQAGAALSVESDAPFVAESGGTPSGD